MNPAMLKLLRPFLTQFVAKYVAEALNRRRERTRERLFEQWLAERRGEVSPASAVINQADADLELASPSPVREPNMLWWGLFGGVVGGIIGFVAASLLSGDEV